ncbi:hypothetical protein SUGI_0070380 [Cryptomeria japonica]|uniref:uncharacterized protein LOC131044939 isoform X3 n=1 Tax=Cryptomeria japonica TaxID=3369 RepID=UPI002408B4E1|nr:uncharacterized protein LOC131044939 isoform X3 [Cryptomeria japonica]GLJ07590.1 hypothetical protein SUGI_0070380 [Cryptomeria japonica]
MGEAFQFRSYNPQTGFLVADRSPYTLVFNSQSNSWIIGYDVNEDQWSFSIFIPASVGFLYCITEWEGNLLVCASNSTYDRSNQRIRYSLDEGDGHFVFWKLSTKHKLWTEECELDLSNIFHAFWKVSASSGVV